MPPIATNNYENIKSANNNFGNSEFSRYQQSANTNNIINEYDYLNNGTNNNPNNSLNEFSKYRAPIIENSYPSYEGYNYDNNKEKNLFDAAGHQGSNNFTFDPITNFNSQAATTAPVNLTSSWLHGNDFSMTAGELFGTARNNKNETERAKEFGNLGNFSGVNFDQIKIVRMKRFFLHF